VLEFYLGFLFVIVFHVNGGWHCSKIIFRVTILSLLFVSTGFLVVFTVSHLMSVVSDVFLELSVVALHTFPHLNETLSFSIAERRICDRMEQRPK
jgi:hypothetical protein